MSMSYFNQCALKNSPLFIFSVYWLLLISKAKKIILSYSHYRFSASLGSCLQLLECGVLHGLQCEFTLMWPLHGLKGDNLITTVFSTGCTAISDLAPGAPSPLCLPWCGFLQVCFPHIFLTPLSQLPLSIIYPFLNNVSQEDYQHHLALVQWVWSTLDTAEICSVWHICFWSLLNSLNSFFSPFTEAIAALPKLYVNPVRPRVQQFWYCCFIGLDLYNNAFFPSFHNVIF